MKKMDVSKIIKNKKGITLIALVITIIVLLILAGVSIAMLTGQNGILNQAKSAKEETKNAEIEEENRINQYETIINEYVLPSSNETSPYLPGNDFSKVEGTNLENGLVIKDKNNNSYVWVEVPKSIFMTAKTKEEFDSIEKDMILYAKDYRGENYEDTWYEGCGIETEEMYINLKNKMLSSIYEKGGFWISQYEIGSTIVRSNEKVELSEAKSEEGMYPYNYVTCAQAQKLANEMNSGNYTSSLLFGIQWDLTMKYLEEKGTLLDGTKMTKELLQNDSTMWGNYYNSKFSITTGKYSLDRGNTFYEVVTNFEKKEGITVLLSERCNQKKYG